MSRLLCGNVYFKHLGKSDGLSQISVVSICQDELGRMWFGTLEGLSCYDGNGMTVYKPSLIRDNSFLGNEVHNLVSGQGNVFFTSDGILSRYDLRQETFHDLHFKASCLYSDGRDVWVAARDSVFRWSATEGKFLFVCNMVPGRFVTSLYVGTDNVLWIGTISGLYRATGTDYQQLVCVLPAIRVHSLYCDSKGRMWVAAFRNGMYRVEEDSEGGWTVQNDFSLSSNDVRCFVEDDEGSIWIGTFNGLNRIGTDGRITCYRKDVISGSLKHSSVFSLYKDKQGTIWVGTYYGGVHYFHPEADLFRHYSEDVDGKDGVSFPYIGNMVEDKRGNVWICTEGGGLNCWDRKADSFAHYLTGKNGELFFPNLKCIAYDKDFDCLYIGTHKQNFLRFDIRNGRVRCFSDSSKEGDSFAEIILYGDSLLLLSDRGVWVKSKSGNDIPRELCPGVEEVMKGGVTMFMDGTSHLWVARRKDVMRIEMNNRQKRQIYELGEDGLGKFMVTKMAESSDGTIFLGTIGAGLYRYSRETDRFEHCPIAGADYIYNMRFHASGYLILLTDRGVLCYHPQTGDMKILDAENQLHLSAVNDGCGLLVCRDGEVLVGGSEGMTAFAFSSLFEPLPEHNLYFSSLSVNGKLMTAHDKEGVLPVALPFVSELHLAYDENNISISFASNSYIDNSDREFFEYCLEGFDRKWNTTYSNTLFYTNLDPGRYILKVREKKLSERDEVQTIELPLVVHSPWWATWWAYTLYVALFVWIVSFLVRNWMARVHLRASLAQEKMEKEKNEELIQAKLQFFANISHEFRTPLTLIISQLEALLHSSGLSPFVRTRLQKVYKNTFQFRELISELLDFRKMERGKLTLHVGQADLVEYLGRICDDFQPQAQLQHICLAFHSDVSEQFCWYDSRQLRKVVSNLLSNALKYTPADGKVELQLVDAGECIEIKVLDSGEGIPQESIPFIFDRFYQVNAEVSSPGSGIGLALAKGIVELHHGTIGVKSAVGYGSVFTVTLPKENPFLRDDNVVWDAAEPETADGLSVCYETQEADEAVQPSGGVSEESAGEARECVLLVEDNEELLQILTDLLSPLYRVIIAMDGKAGYDKVVDEAPDLVVSDVMMPVMSGTEMCMKIKNNFDLCHIPVILLTAMTSDNSKMEGMQCGADDYIEKPFNNKLLLGRIANLLRNRKLLKKKFGTAVPEPVVAAEPDVPALALTPIDSEFLARLDEIVRNHLSEPEFDVNQLARELGVSRSSLYNKLKALSFVTPNEYILNARLKVAADLLKQNPEMQITEIAYQVGFNSLRYFRHCFKASFNRTPQEYRQDK